MRRNPQYPPHYADVDASPPQTDEESDEELWLEANCEPIYYPTERVSSQKRPHIYIFTSTKHARLVIYQCEQHIKQCREWKELTQESLSAAKALPDPAMVSAHHMELDILTQIIEDTAFQLRIARNPRAYTIPGQLDTELLSTGLPIGGPHLVTLAGATLRYALTR